MAGCFNVRWVHTTYIMLMPTGMELMRRVNVNGDAESNTLKLTPERHLNDRISIKYLGINQTSTGTSKSPHSVNECQISHLLGKCKKDPSFRKHKAWLRSLKRLWVFKVLFPKWIIRSLNEMQFDQTEQHQLSNMRTTHTFWSMGTLSGS